MKNEGVVGSWRGLFYIIIGAFIFAGAVFDSFNLCSSFGNRFFAFFLIMVVGYVIYGVVQKENKEKKDKVESEKIIKKYFGENK